MSWGNTDDAANSVSYAPAQFNKVANSANQTDLFGNTTADAFVTGQTIGQFGVSAGEVQAARAGANTKMGHTGWHLRTVGSGGRAGRVMYETLVAMRTITDDAEDAVLPDYILRVDTQPSDASANSTANARASFTVVANSTPTGATITYVWQKWGGASFANLSNAGAYSNTTTATLSVLANTAANGEIYRAGIYASGAATIYSSNGVLTITT